jgi:hypothetical protein
MRAFGGFAEMAPMAGASVYTLPTALVNPNE